MSVPRAEPQEQEKNYLEPSSAISTQGTETTNESLTQTMRRATKEWKQQMNDSDTNSAMCYVTLGPKLEVGVPNRTNRPQHFQLSHRLSRDHDHSVSNYSSKAHRQP